MEGFPMSVGLASDLRFEEHETGPGHPERPERLRRVRAALERAGLVQQCRKLPIVRAEDELLTAVHDPAYVEHVERAIAAGARILDSDDTAVGPTSAEIARLAAGTLAAAAVEVARGNLQSAFVAVRPPGHHAERALAMGFCLFNNVAVAARHLQREPGVERVLIVDWDVHHGNGTQHIFDEDPSVFYFSVHQSPLYPGTGARDERGRGAGLGTTLNCPLPPGAGDDEFLGALAGELVPAAARFRPDFVLVSAGFDAHRADPLANLLVTSEAYAEATRILLGIAADTAKGRLVSVLEGGYDLEALSSSVVEHVKTLVEGG
jgi:acetoin utilization deacetylase AcuC-like enzyme